LVVFSALVACGCATSSGERATAFHDSRIAGAYLPLSTTNFLIDTRRGAAVFLAPDIAVTVAHNANLLKSAEVIGQSASYDLLFFRPGRTGSPVASGEPRLNERVLAYGEGAHGELRVGNGVVTVLAAEVRPLCASCPLQIAFTFKGNAGKGFSGGPVIDADDGHLLGIVFGYREGEPRSIYAYDMRLVTEELAKIEKGVASRDH
jgi:hypothetical protein